MIDNIHPTVAAIIASIYTPSNLQCSNIIIEAESKEYGACTLTLNNHKVVFRIAKTTPTKIGQFVTVWKRNKQGITAPHDLSDDFNSIIISVSDDNHSGQFIFPKDALAKHGIISKNDIGGKRGLRVYPSWCKAVNKQAIKTQAWQLKYFVDTTNVTNETLQKVKQLISV